MGDWWGLTLNLWPDRENDSPSWAITACILLTNPHHPTSNINVGPDVRGSAKWPSLSIHSAPICQELATATSLESECLDVVCNNFGSWKMNTAWHICRGGVMAKKHSLRMYEHLAWISATRINYHQLTARIFCLLQEISSCPTLAAASFRVASIAHCGLGLF